MASVEERVDARATGTLRDLIKSWVRSMRARNLSDQTIATYAESACQLDGYLAAAGVSRIDRVTRAHVETFVADLTRTKSAATASVRYRALQQFFGWLLEEEELEHSPMARMRPPIVPEHPVPIVSEDELRGLLRSLDGKDFLSRRDSAILRLFLDTGLRRAELAGITVDGVELDVRTVEVLGKGRRPRIVRYGAKTALAMDRYARLRSRQSLAHLPAWWLGERSRGGMTPDGVYQMLSRRAAAVGLDVHPHQLRHSWAHYFLAAGGSETDLMHNAGWKSRQMLSRYARSTAEERARQAAARLSLGDRL